MARLESESKGGFYPTPPEEMDFILKAVKALPGQNITVLDPCAGEGKALAQFKSKIEADGANCVSYGIELEKSRAKAAESELDHVIAAGYEESRISHGAFSAMYLNPPFAQLQGQRLEKIFLDDLSKDYIAEGSLLIFNIPIYVLRDTAPLLASRFINIRAFRFSDINGNYNRYQQIIVFAERRRKGLKTKNERIEQEVVEKDLINKSFLGKDAFTPLDQLHLLDVEYTLKPANKEVQMFYSMKVEPDDIIQSQQKTDHYSRVEQKMSSLEITSTAKNIRPALPLKTTHIAAAIASGALPESMGSHMLVGITKRVQDERKEFDPKTGKEKEITTLKPKSIVRIFSEKGIINLK